MSVRRPMGIETELGITSTQLDQAGRPLSPMVLSGQVVRAYAARVGPAGALEPRGAWDYADESPLRDARGYEMARALADVSQLTDIDDPTVAATVLSNGARLYVDHAHPEYSAPEVTSPREALRYDRAGELVARRAVESLAAEGRDVRLYKNNVDGKGASYGTHENYLVPRTVPFAAVARTLVPFFVARPLICGAGRVGIGQASEEAGFQISQRADYLEAEVGLETTLRRPIVNTRDEPHATPHVHRRLHVIVGDATMADLSTLLALGSTSLVLRVLETHPHLLPGIELAAPVAAAHELSHDTSLQATVLTTDGRRLTGLNLLEAHLQACETAAPELEQDDDTTEVLTRWRQVLDGLRRDPATVAEQVEWVAKLTLLQRFRERSGAGWEDPRVRAMDIQWHDLDPDRGLAQRLRAAGRLERLLPDEAIERAVTEPPEDTRAWFRGACISRFPGQVRGASWDSVVLADEAGRPRRVTLPEPTEGTRAQIEALLTRHTSAASLLTELASDEV